MAADLLETLTLTVKAEGRFSGGVLNVAFNRVGTSSLERLSLLCMLRMNPGLLPPFRINHGRRRCHLSVRGFGDVAGLSYLELKLRPN